MTKKLIETKSKTQLIMELCQLIGENLVLHYICSECDSDQVTYDNEFLYEDLEQLIEEGCLYVWYDCTDCGRVLKFLQAQNITAIEIMDGG